MLTRILPYLPHILSYLTLLSEYIVSRITDSDNFYLPTYRPIFSYIKKLCSCMVISGYHKLRLLLENLKFVKSQAETRSHNSWN